MVKMMMRGNDGDDEGAQSKLKSWVLKVIRKGVGVMGNSDDDDEGEYW